MNIDLNAGGFIGAALGAIVGSVAWYYLTPPLDGSTAVVVSIIIGAVGGTILWKAIYPKTEAPK